MFYDTDHFSLHKLSGVNTSPVGQGALQQIQLIYGPSFSLGKTPSRNNRHNSFFTLTRFNILKILIFPSGCVLFYYQSRSTSEHSQMWDSSQLARGFFLTVSLYSFTLPSSYCNFKQHFKDHKVLQVCFVKQQTKKSY